MAPIGISTSDTQLASLFESVPDMWRHRVASTPDTEAFITRHGTYWRETTWQSADRRVMKLANGLLAHGLQAEDRCRNHSGWCAACLGNLFVKLRHKIK